LPSRTTRCNILDVVAPRSVALWARARSRRPAVHQRGNVMRFLLVAALAIVCPRPALAGTPVVDPPNCTVPGTILIVGANGVVADPLGAFSVTVRDFNNFPIANSSVTIKFYCAGIRICQYQAGLI